MTARDTFTHHPAAEVFLFFGQTSHRHVNAGHNSPPSRESPERSKRFVTLATALVSSWRLNPCRGGRFLCLTHLVRLWFLLSRRLPHTFCSVTALRNVQQLSVAEAPPPRLRAEGKVEEAPTVSSRAPFGGR